MRPPISFSNDGISFLYPIKTDVSLKKIQSQIFIDIKYIPVAKVLGSSEEAKAALGWGPHFIRRLAPRLAAPT